jgi:RNA polymerase sigma factor (sigma-70 family)
MALAIARTLTRAPATPEDVVQEAALALHAAHARDPARFAGPEHARNYFLRAVRNLALRSARAAGREQPLASDPPAPEGDDPGARALLARQRALARLLLELDPAGRELIARRFLEHHTLARIAQETGVPISTLHDRERSLLAELRRKLEVELEKGDDQEAAG